MRRWWATTVSLLFLVLDGGFAGVHEAVSSKYGRSHHSTADSHGLAHHKHKTIRHPHGQHHKHEHISSAHARGGEGRKKVRRGSTKIRLPEAQHTSLESKEDRHHHHHRVKSHQPRTPNESFRRPPPRHHLYDVEENVNISSEMPRHGLPDDINVDDYVVATGADPGKRIPESCENGEIKTGTDTVTRCRCATGFELRRTWYRNKNGPAYGGPMKETSDDEKEDVELNTIKSLGSKYDVEGNDLPMVLWCKEATCDNGEVSEDRTECKCNSGYYGGGKAWTEDHAANETEEEDIPYTHKGCSHLGWTIFAVFIGILLFLLVIGVLFGPLIMAFAFPITKDDCVEGATTDVPSNFSVDEKFWSMTTECELRDTTGTNGTDTDAKPYVGVFNVRMYDASTTITYKDKNGKFAAFQRREPFQFFGTEVDITLCDHPEVKYTFDDSGNYFSNFFSAFQNKMVLKKDGVVIAESNKDSFWETTVQVVSPENNTEIGIIKKDVFNWGSDHWEATVKDPGTLKPVLLGFVAAAVTRAQNKRNSRRRSSFFAGVSSSRKSDRNLKSSIIRTGTSPTGIPEYAFTYTSDPAQVIHHGTMAQDLLKLGRHDAVWTGDDGFLNVDYGRIDVNFD